MSTQAPSASRMPVLFVGHGSPINAIEDNEWSRGFARLAELVPRPQAILAISAHWYVPGTRVLSHPSPRTIHDFGGFPQALREVQYPAKGDPNLAKRVRRALGENRAALDEEWGLDHGTWSVLVKTYPQAHVPVIQLSIDQRLDGPAHLELARSLVELRDEGVLIVGSGNATHNLRDAFTRMQTGNAQTPDWARRFDDAIVAAATQRDDRRIATMWSDTDDGRASHPTPDHYLPLVYAYAATDARDTVSFPITGFDHSLSMRSILFA